MNKGVETGFKPENGPDPLISPEAKPNKMAAEWSKDEHAHEFNEQTNYVPTKTIVTVGWLDFIVDSSSV